MYETAAKFSIVICIVLYWNSKHHWNRNYFTSKRWDIKHWRKKDSPTSNLIENAHIQINIYVCFHINQMCFQISPGFRSYFHSSNCDSTIALMNFVVFEYFFSKIKKIAVLFIGENFFFHICCFFHQFFTSESNRWKSM